MPDCCGRVGCRAFSAILMLRAVVAALLLTLMSVRRIVQVNAGSMAPITAVQFGAYQAFQQAICKLTGVRHGPRHGCCTPVTAQSLWRLSAQAYQHLLHELQPATAVCRLLPVSNLFATTVVL